MFTLSEAQIEQWLALLLWPLFRILGIFATDPFFSALVIPRQVRVVLALLISFLVAPLLPPLPEVEIVSALGVLVALQQIIIGMAIGFSMRLIFSAVEMGGTLAGLQMGLGFAQFYDPQHGANVPVVAQLASLVMILLFLSMNGPLVVIDILVKSFTVLPIEATPLHALSFKTLAEAAKHIFAVGLLLALPIITAMLITNLAIGILTRAAPQFNLFAVGFPITVGIGVVALYVSLPQFSPYVQRLIDYAAELSLTLSRLAWRGLN